MGGERERGRFLDSSKETFYTLQSIKNIGRVVVAKERERKRESLSMKKIPFKKCHEKFLFLESKNSFPRVVCRGERVREKEWNISTSTASNPEHVFFRPSIQMDYDVCISEQQTSVVID